MLIMAGKEPDLTLQEMMKRGPEWLDAYLRPFEQGKPAPHSMIGIESVARPLAYYYKSLDWAGIAVRAGELLAGENGGAFRGSALNKTMALRAWFISNLGSKVGHPVLDRDIILRWFKTETPFAPEDALETFAPLKTIKLSSVPAGKKRPTISQELLEKLARGEYSKSRWSDLTALLGRLNVLQRLAECGELPVDPEFAAWLKVKATLSRPNPRETA
jgi:hypothetical protein